MIPLSPSVPLSLLKTKFDVLCLLDSSFLKCPLVRSVASIRRRELSLLNARDLIQLDGKSRETIIYLCFLWQ